MTLTDAEIADGYVLACPVIRRAIWFSPEVKIPGGATAYRGYSAVRFGSPEKAQCAASGKSPATKTNAQAT